MSNINDFVIENGVLTKYVGEGGDVVIPEGVTSIGDSAFYACRKLTSITIPDSVTSIGDRVFCNCSNLQNIVVPDSVTSIGHGAFCGCKSLADKEGLVIVKDTLYDYFGTANDISIPDSVTSIGEDAFCGCDSLQNIVIPDGVTSIGYQAFQLCNSLQNIVIPDSVTSIGKLAFFSCSNLQNIVIPDGVTSIGDNAFQYCNSLQNIVIPDSVVSVSGYCFSGCKKIKYLSVPARLSDCVNSVDPDAAVLVREDEAVHFYAYSKKGDSNTWKDLINTGLLEEYDRELLNNGPKYKFSLITRLVGMLGRLKEDQNLRDDFRNEFLQLLIKNAKKLITFAEQMQSPKILEKMFDTGIINTDNAKAIRKILAASADECIAALANREIREATEKPATRKEAPSEASDPLVEKYRKKLEEINADKIIRNMKLKGSDMPSVNLKDGSQAPEELFRFILASYGAQYSLLYTRVIPDADEAADLLSYDSLCEAMEEVSDSLNAVYYPALLPLLCRYSNPAQIKQLINSIKAWDDWSHYRQKGKNADRKLYEHLVLSDTKVAALHLEKNGELERFAQIRDITVEEVYDKYIFDFKFDENGTRSFDIGGTIIEVSISDDLKLQMYNRTTGKNIRTVPKKSSDPDKRQLVADEIDDMKKSLKDAVKIKQRQLFADYIDAQESSAEKWADRYLKNELLNRIARILVWSQDDKTFLLTDKGLITSDASPYTLSDSPVKIAHPIEMTEEDVTAWQKYFTAHALKQPFEQIWENCINPKDFSSDRYKHCYINKVYLNNQEKRGISFWQSTIEIKGFKAANRVHYDDYVTKIEITGIEPKTWNRRANMVIAFLDRLTVYGRIKNDDVSILKRFCRRTPLRKLQISFRWLPKAMQPM